MICTKKHYGEETPTSFPKLRLFMGKLQKRFSLLAAAREVEASDFEEMEVPTVVPDDVKEGHVAVLAVKGSEKKRFVVKLECLNSPTFLRLLVQAEEEYGFEQTGALVVPCRPEELHKILQRHGQEDQIEIVGK